MTDPTNPDPSPESFADLPMQPTGSGVADLEIAYEQMKMAEGDTLMNATEDRVVEPNDVALTTRDDRLESEAHPS